MSGLVEDADKRMTSSCSARGATPSVAPLHVAPRMILTPSTSVSRLYAVIASADVHLESSTMSFSGRPLMPPAGVDLVHRNQLGPGKRNAIGLANPSQRVQRADDEGLLRGVGLSRCARGGRRRGLGARGPAAACSPQASRSAAVRASKAMVLAGNGPHGITLRDSVGRASSIDSAIFWRRCRGGVPPTASPIDPAADRQTLVPEAS